MSAPSFEPQAIPDVVLVRPATFGDARGWFRETYSRNRYEAAGIAGEFVQDNHSYSAPANTVRGLHFQRRPQPQGKLVRVLRGRIFDVAVDIRRGSPTYGRHVAVELSAAGGEQLWVPVGFAHGFCTLEPDCEVAYKVTAYYSAEHDAGISWIDPDLGIAWPCTPEEAALSAKDTAAPRLRDIEPPF